MAEPRTVPPALRWGASMAWRIIIVGALVWFVAMALLSLRVVVLPVFVALLIATLMAPPVGFLSDRGVPRLLATWAVFLPSVGFLVGIFWVLVPPLVDQFSQLGQELSEGLEELQDFLLNGPFNLTQQQLDDLIDQARSALEGRSSGIVSRVLSGAMVALEVVAGILLAGFLTFFFVKDGPRMWTWFLNLLDERRREEAEALGQKAWGALRGYIGGSVVAGVIEASITGIALWIIGVPLVVPIAVLFFLAPFFPIIGAIVAGAIAALVALVSGGVTQALIVVAVVTVIQQVEGDLLLPLVLGRAVQLHPVVIMVVLTAGGVLAGIIGAFVAVPVTAAVTAMGAELRQRRWHRSEPP